MNARLFFCIALGVFTAHIGVFMLWSHLRPQPKTVLPPKPNFSAIATTVTNAETGEKTIYREITVSTKLVPRDPPPPETPHLDGPTAP